MENCFSNWLGGKAADPPSPKSPVEALSSGKRKRFAHANPRKTSPFPYAAGSMEMYGASRDQMGGGTSTPTRGQRQVGRHKQSSRLTAMQLARIHPCCYTEDQNYCSALSVSLPCDLQATSHERKSEVWVPRQASSQVFRPCSHGQVP